MNRNIRQIMTIGMVTIRMTSLISHQRMSMGLNMILKKVLMLWIGPLPNRIRAGELAVML